MVLIDLRASRLTGVVAERALEECGILVNRNRIPDDTRPPLVTSGVRLGCNILAQRGMGPEHMRECAELMHAVLTATTPLSDTEYRIDPHQRVHLRARVRALCARHPLPHATARADGPGALRTGASL
jgi:glycine hydroxymethyltransferase